MKYKCRKLECLVDHKTGEPLIIRVPENETDEYDKISERAFRSGQEFKEMLKTEK